MDVKRTSGAASYIDIVDRVLDKGIVLDGWMRFAVGGIDLITIEGHVIIASIDTYLEHRAAVDAARGIAKGSSICDVV